MKLETFNGPIAVGMSGGVDSSVAAALLKERHGTVFGVTAVMTRERSRCCAEEDVVLAGEVCRRLGIAHHVLDVCEAFQEFVIDPFVRDYLSGRTPSPCALCNRHVKFGALLDKARELGAVAVATGHYAQVWRDGQAGWALKRGVDAEKDQSYFLALLTQAQLGAALFPLGGMTKPDVVRLARERDLPTRGARESQDLCFVGERGPGAWLDVRCLSVPGPGDIVDTEGRTLGRHIGLHHYTVGQRKGLGIATGAPVYVVALDAERNRVIVGGRAAALRPRMTVERVSWIAGRAPSASFRAAAQIRYNHVAAAATITPRGADAADVQFDDPQFAIAPGQLAVFYDGDRVLGGGWIRAAG